MPARKTSMDIYLQIMQKYSIPPAVEQVRTRILNGGTQALSVVDGDVVDEIWMFEAEVANDINSLSKQEQDDVQKNIDAMADSDIPHPQLKFFNQMKTLGVSPSRPTRVVSVKNFQPSSSSLT